MIISFSMYSDYFIEKTGDVDTGSSKSYMSQGNLRRYVYTSFCLVLITQKIIDSNKISKIF